MADKERRNSLIRSSISINSIRDSASEFSKGLTRTNVLPGPKSLKSTTWLAGVKPI